MRGFNEFEKNKWFVSRSVDLLLSSIKLSFYERTSNF